MRIYIDMYIYAYKHMYTPAPTQVEVVLDPATGQALTLGQVFEALGITPETLSIDRLNVSANKRTFNRSVS